MSKEEKNPTPVRTHLEGLANNSDCMICIVGERVSDDKMQLEYGINADENELETMFVSLFGMDESLKDVIRGAILISDYGKRDIDLDINLN